MLSLLLSLFLVSPANADVSVPRAKQYAWTTYDVAVLGGQSTGHALGLQLPAGSIVTDVWVYINTAFTDSGTGSLGLQCAGTNDLMAYNDITGFSAGTAVGRHLLPNAFPTGSIIPENAVAGALTLSSANGSIATACDVAAVVRSDAGYVPLTAGKLTAIIEYFKLY